MNWVNCVGRENKKETQKELNKDWNSKIKLQKYKLIKNIKIKVPHHQNQTEI